MFRDMYDPYFAFLYNIQGGQLILIILAIMILFGSKRLPEIAKTLGKALHEFKKAASDVENTLNEKPSARPEPSIPTPVSTVEVPSNASVQPASGSEHPKSVDAHIDRV